MLRQRQLMKPEPFTLFALLWMCSPMLLFSLAGNILPAYVLPGLPAVGFLAIKALPKMRPAYLFLIGPAL